MCTAHSPIGIARIQLSSRASSLAGFTRINRDYNKRDKKRANTRSNEDARWKSRGEFFQSELHLILLRLRRIIRINKRPPPPPRRSQKPIGIKGELPLGRDAVEIRYIFARVLHNEKGCAVFRRGGNWRRRFYLVLRGCA